MGILLSPIGVLGSAVLLQAALISVGVGSALCYVAYRYQMDGVETIRRQLQVIFGTIAVGSFLVGMFPATAMAYGLNKLFVYGTIALYGLFFMAHTQEVVDLAENHRLDPIKDSMGLYLNSLNFFLRIADLVKRNHLPASS
jgi:growth hormone-inducible transmembrane protein